MHQTLNDDLQASTRGCINDFTGSAYDYGPKYVRDSLTDMEYQPIHEEGNLFSHHPARAANKGCIVGAILTTPTRWSFRTFSFTSSADFKDVSADEHQTCTGVDGEPHTRKADPALLLALKFIEEGNDFAANPDSKAAIQIRGMRYFCLNS